MAGSGGRRSKRGGAKMKGKKKAGGRKVSAKKGRSR
jgi:hypothetical protein